jgi:hypothetical protein
MAASASLSLSRRERFGTWPRGFTNAAGVSFKATYNRICLAVAVATRTMRDVA